MESGYQCGFIEEVVTMCGYCPSPPEKLVKEYIDF
jgi:hypothetical protein